MDGKGTFLQSLQKNYLLYTSSTTHLNTVSPSPSYHRFLLSVLLPNIMHFYRRRTPGRNRKSPIRPILSMNQESAFPIQEGLSSLGTDLQSANSQDMS